MGNKLDDLLEAQASLLKKLTNLTIVKDAPELDLINNTLTCMSNEVEEARRELPWKHWKTYKDYKFNRTHFIEETIDIFHFLLEIWVFLGLTSDEIYTEYFKKLKVNLKRWKDDGRIDE